MRPHFIVLTDPGIGIHLQLFKAVIESLAERHAVELILDRSMEALTNAVRLRGIRLCFRVVDVLHCEIELVFVMLPVAAVLRSAIGEDEGIMLNSEMIHPDL